MRERRRGRRADGGETPGAAALAGQEARPALRGGVPGPGPPRAGASKPAPIGPSFTLSSEVALPRQRASYSLKPFLFSSDQMCSVESAQRLDLSKSTHGRFPECLTVPK